MKLGKIADELKLENLTAAADIAGPDVTGGYASDLLSDVLANAPRGGVLVTVQVHLNVIAVAMHAELSGVIFAGGRRPEPAVIQRAVDEGLPLLATALPAFEVVGRLYHLGIRGQV